MLRSRTLHKIQSREYSRDGGMDGTLHETAWAVNANWNSDLDGWNVEANSVENPNKWNAGNQVVSRNYNFSPALSRTGVFVYSLFPTA